jgi:hypothetical protein
MSETKTAADFKKFIEDTRRDGMREEELKIQKELQDAVDGLDFEMLRRLGGKFGLRLHGWRDVGVRLISGEKIMIRSPVFLKAKPKSRGAGRPPKRRKDVLVHLGLEYLGIINLTSSYLIDICVRTATLCPSFELASDTVKSLGINMNPTLLRNIVMRFGRVAMTCRGACHADAALDKPGLKVLVCCDAGRARGRSPKRGKRAEGLKRQGYHSDWFAPWILTISVFGPDGKRDKSISEVIDGSCGNIDEFFTLLEEHLRKVNLAEAAEIVFCADNGAGIWPRCAALAEKLKMKDPKFILDYTHAKQNMGEVAALLAATLKLKDKPAEKLREEIMDMLWQGDILGVKKLVADRLSVKVKGARAALKKANRKLDDYFADANKFRYAFYRDGGLPIGSGSVESAVRRVINLRVKSTGSFWKKENAEAMLFLRSLVLTGKLEIAIEITGRRRHNFNEIINFHDNAIAA